MTRRGRFDDPNGAAAEQPLCNKENDGGGRVSFARGLVIALLMASAFWIALAVAAYTLIR
jgi:hypothetical protein